MVGNILSVLLVLTGAVIISLVYPFYLTDKRLIHILWACCDSDLRDQLDPGFGTLQWFSTLIFDFNIELTILTVCLNVKE